MKSQDPENQLRELREEARKLGYTVSPELEYVDRETGTGKRRREQYEKMIYDAEHGRFTVLLIWALDRVSREGALKTLLLIERLNRSGVKIKSLHEPWLDPASPTYELLLPIFSWVASAEAIRVSMRVKSGLEKWRAMNPDRRLGRPPCDVDHQEVIETHRRLASVRETGRTLNLSRSMVYRVLKAHKLSGKTHQITGSNGKGNQEPAR